ncbi:MAG: deoxyribose-phosphate aldolase [Verrucomicrobiae bacterium]|nr:deoxyribose-phosphate aldolase [Verrucomicrobiae bacterium]
MKYTYEELAGMIDHSLLHPALTDHELEEGCRLAIRYKVASVCIKPYAVRMAAQILNGTSVKVGTVVGFPHGNSTPEVKQFETATACSEGAAEIDMVINIGKVLSREWAYVEREIGLICSEAHRRNAIVKVIFETDFLPTDDIKITLCKISEEAGADFVKTSTGFGFVKGPDGKYDYRGATVHDVKLMRAACSSRVRIKAAGGIRDLDTLIMFKELGVTRCGATATAQILDEYNRRAAAGAPMHNSTGA